MSEEKVTRKSSTPIKVYCLPEEKAIIEDQAKKAGMSAARYLREVGQSYELKSVVDYQKVIELSKINGDLGRLGGLLKLWLTNDEKAARFNDEVIRAVLQRVLETQDEMTELMSKVLASRES